MEPEQFAELLGLLEDIRFWARVVGIAACWCAGHMIWDNALRALKRDNFL